MNLVLKMAILARFPSQSEFAQVAGIGESLLSRIVRERVSPTSEQKRKMAEVLKTPEGQLFPGTAVDDTESAGNAL